MTTKIVYLKDHDGHKVGKSYDIERSLASRLIEGKIAVPQTVHDERIRMEKELKKQPVKKAEKPVEKLEPEASKDDEESIEKLLANKDKSKVETAESSKKAKKK